MIVIDLKEFKKEASVSEYFTPYYKSFMEVLDRAIAAESERDELKAKLAEMEMYKNNLEAAESDNSKLKEFIGVLEKDNWILKENNSLKEVGYMVRGNFFYSKQAAEDSALHINSNHENCEITTVYISESQPIANNSELAQRITEQDAREIIEKYNDWKEYESFRDFSVEQFLKEDASKTLLAKLNEHREQVQTSEPVAVVQEITETNRNRWSAKDFKKLSNLPPSTKIYADYPPLNVRHPDEVLVLMNHIEDVLPDSTWDLIDNKIWNSVSSLYAHQAAPNKAEVQVWQPIDSAPKDKLIDIWIENKDGSGVRWSDCYYDQICDDWRTIAASGHLVFVPARCVTHWMNSPLPPLKGE